MNKISHEEVLTTKEASKYLKIAPRTLYRHIREHNIPAFKLGRDWRFIKSELDRWLMKKVQDYHKKVNKVDNK
jgi:excisionase family DNA binding protein